MYEILSIQFENKILTPTHCVMSFESTSVVCSIYVIQRLILYAN